MNITIVTITYNAEKWIEKTIDSVLRQGKYIYEYIIVDGLSIDKTYDIVSSYDDKFKEAGIRYSHITEKDKGISDAFNKGILMATGELIGLINAADELTENALAVLQKTVQNEAADIYYGNCVWVDEANGMEYVSKPGHDLKKLLYYMILIHPSTFVKREVYEECGLFDISYKYCMDKELLYRLYLNDKKFLYIDYELTRFCAGGISDQNAAAVYREGSRMALKYGEPKIKVFLIEHKKLFRNRLARSCKKLKLYQLWKHAKKIDV